METTEQQNELFKTAQQPKTRECDWCSKPYSNNHNSMYCSTSCKNSASRKRVTDRKRSALGVEKEVPKNEPMVVASLAGTLDLQPHAKYIIAQQEKELTRWENHYNKEVDKREKAEAENIKLKDQLKDFEHKKALDGIESARPDFLEKLQQFIPEDVRGKVLGAIAEKFLTPGPMMAGVGGQLDGEGQQQITNINTWFSTLPKEGQVMVYSILDLFAKQPVEQLAQTLSHVLNLLNNGTTAIPNSNANYGT